MSAFDQVAALRHQNKELLERLSVKQKSYRQLRRGRERGEQAGGRERGEQAGEGEREQAGAGEREQAGAGREGSRQGAGREGAGRGRERGSRQGAGREGAGRGRGEGAGRGRERGSRQGQGERGAGRGRERGSRQGAGEREQAGAGREGAGRGRREGSRQGEGEREQAGGGREEQAGAGEREQAGAGREGSRQGQGEREQAGAGRGGAGRGRERGSRQGAGRGEQAGAGEREQAGAGRVFPLRHLREPQPWGRGSDHRPRRGGQPGSPAALTASLRSRAGEREKERGSETQGRGSETQGRGSETLRYTDQLLHLGNDRQRDAFIRETRRPKPILLPPHGRERKGATHVTFQSPEEASEGDGWSVRPFLGYDWIAGVLDADSSLSEKSEPFFTELRDFRQVNREECVHQEYMEAEQLDLLPLTSVKAPQVLDYSRDTHQCRSPLISSSVSRPSVFTPSLSPSLSGTHCYRVNSRLFAVPLDPQAACPVCKTPRSQSPAPSAQEPAFIRVSIPRSTLLPAYRYKAHRRKSFDPSDSLALPSHCLSGWSSTAPPAAPSMNSLDLKTSVKPETASSVLSTSALYLSQLDCSVSRVMGGAHTDHLLDLSRSARYHFQRLDQNQELSRSKPHSTAYPVY
ncbi:migration and invasion-inhibitory protein-like [Acipenser oxyrinchus oxyrinchus]|uniref:Migration and invasion-inhibitory protein-like n=1 Tax=Acipenser oxyrinchus oxyrinchus TaxID=40147 RepID=A0AAD8CZM3_ACIOX|nr:migration and invasion-inhibitory protein-like [Acipenser oxyrinchus oxyrinchus]